MTFKCFAHLQWFFLKIQLSHSSSIIENLQIEAKISFFLHLNKGRQNGRQASPIKCTFPARKPVLFPLSWHHFEPSLVCLALNWFPWGHRDLCNLIFDSSSTSWIISPAASSPVFLASFTMLRLLLLGLLASLASCASLAAPEDTPWPDVEDDCYQMDLTCVNGSFYPAILYYSALHCSMNSAVHCNTQSYF